MDLFERDFLQRHLDSFNLNQVFDLNSKKETILKWIDSIRSKKVLASKEESIKGEYLEDIFGEILDYNRGNNRHYNLAVEQKTVIDGKKADGALGYFSVNTNAEVASDVRVVIELKDAQTELDKPQKRADFKFSSVKQAFSYSTAMGGNCKWVIVSNFIELRLYHATDESRYKFFKIEELLEENTLKEFIFLLSRDRLISRTGKSKIDRLYEVSKEFNRQNGAVKSLHILDQLYQCLIRFKGFGFIDPYLLANCKPFNLRDEYVHHYHRFNLQSTNIHIYKLLNRVSIDGDNERFLFEESLLTELKEYNVSDYEHKLKYVMEQLNASLVSSVTVVVEEPEEIERKNRNVIGFSLESSFAYSRASWAKTFDISFSTSSICRCIPCRFDNFEFTDILEELKTHQGVSGSETMGMAYARYKLPSNNYRDAYIAFRNLATMYKGKEGKEIEYFIAKYNCSRFYHLLWDDEMLGDRSIRSEIKSIDLDRVISEEIDVVIDPDVRKLLLELKEDYFFERVKKNVTACLEKIQSLRQMYLSGGEQMAGPNYWAELHENLLLMYYFVRSNFLVFDMFDDYKKIIAKIFEGFVVSYSTPYYQYSLKCFDAFYLTQAILHFHTNDLQNVFAKYSVDDFEIEEGGEEQLLKKVKNFLQSNHDEKLVLGKVIANKLIDPVLNTFSFEQFYSNLFSNIFIILAKGKISKDGFRSIVPVLINFLQIEDVLGWNDLEYMGKFVEKRGAFFTEEELYELLKVANSRNKFDSTKYEKLIYYLCYSIEANYPNFKVSSRSVILKAVSDSVSDSGYSRVKDLIPIWKVSNNYNRSVLMGIFVEELDKNFNGDLYERLLRDNVLDVEYEKYFPLYIRSIKEIKDDGKYELRNSVPYFRNLYFLNFMLLVYQLNIDVRHEVFEQFDQLSSFESWLLHPDIFDYSEFKPEWILATDFDAFLSEFRKIPQIRECVKQELSVKFNPKLAEIYFKFLT